MRGVGQYVAAAEDFLMAASDRMTCSGARPMIRLRKIWTAKTVTATPTSSARARDARFA